MLVSACRFCHPVSPAAFILGAFFCLVVLVAKSDAKSDPRSDVTGDPFASSWSEQAGGAAKMRLISIALSQGVYATAVEIKLAPTAITYWRQPGEAGVPPEFSFAGSENVASTEILYPAPSRLDEGGIQAFGYRGGVTFPIRVRPADAKKPARLALTLNYAICDRICVPAKGHVELLLPQSGDSPGGAAIAAAMARVPSVLPAAELADKVAIRVQTGQAKPHWVLVWRGDRPAADLFAEGPEGWAFETRKTAENTFSLAAVETPANSAAGVSVRLTLTGPGKPYEFTLPLAVGLGAR